MLKLLLWLILQAIGQIFIAANVPKMQKQSSHLVTLPNLECLFSMSQTKKGLSMSHLTFYPICKHTICPTTPQVKFP